MMAAAGKSCHLSDVKVRNMNNDRIFEELIANWNQYPPLLRISMAVVIGLLVVCALVSLVVSIYLAVSYHRYNRKQNSVNRTGEEIARGVLDANDLSSIKVDCSGSLLFGNSYSHYFKKVRLRRRTWKESSVSSMAMAVQKSCLAIMDKEQDPDMVRRVRLTPFIYVGPIACIPLILIGVVLDILVFKSAGAITVGATLLGLGFYLMSFFMALYVLKTEIKAQNRAYEIVRAYDIATEEEIDDMKQLFRLYNIEYINNMVTALLEILLRVLYIVADSKGSSKD